MGKHVYTNLVNSEGIFTYNFFCESIISSLHTLLHIMEHAKLDPPEQLASIPDMLAKMGTNLMQDYSEEKVDLDRLKTEMVDFYNVAFAVNETMVPVVTHGSDELQYYYFVFEQGIKIMFPTLLENISMDLPEGVRADDFMDEMMTEFIQ